MNNINKSISLECHCSEYACQGDYNYSMHPDNRSVATVKFYLNIKRQIANLEVYIIRSKLHRNKFNRYDFRPE